MILLSTQSSDTFKPAIIPHYSVKAYFCRCVLTRNYNKILPNTAINFGPFHPGKLYLHVRYALSEVVDRETGIGLGKEGDITEFPSIPVRALLLNFGIGDLGVL